MMLYDCMLRSFKQPGAGASGGTQSVVWSPRETQDTLASRAYDLSL